MKKLTLELLTQRMAQVKAQKKNYRISARFQEVGIEIANKLEDKKHTGLYIKLAKKYKEIFLMGILSEVLEIDAKHFIRNKGAYFLTLIQKRLQ
jgi:hypothetical protein